MNLREFSNENLLQKARELMQSERELTITILHHLREIERRNLFAVRGFSSLFEYCVTDLGYSESAAQRRISSMRLLKAVPAIEEKIESGALSLSTLSFAQSFFRTENIKNSDTKLEILSVLEGKSNIEVKRELILRSQNPAKLVPETVRPVTATHSQVTLLVEDTLLKQVNELRALLAFSHPNMNLQEALRFSVETTLALQLKRKSKTKSATPLPPAAVKKSEASRHIPADVKRAVWQRDKGECAYVDKKTGRKCCSKYGIQYDHITPFALGGANTIKNLRLCCLAHNQLAAIGVFGIKRMSQHIPRFR